VYGATDRVVAEWKKLSGLINTHKKYREIFKAPLTSDRDRVTGLRVVLKKAGSSWHPITIRALENLGAVKSLPLVTSINEHLTRMTKDFLKQVDVLITTSGKDDQATFNRIKEKLKAKMPPDARPTFNHAINKSLLDGFIVTVDGDVFADRSYRTKLEGDARQYLTQLQLQKKELVRKRDFMNTLSLAPAARSRGLWQELMRHAKHLDVTASKAEKEVAATAGKIEISPEKIRKRLALLAEVYDFKKPEQQV